MPKLEFTPTSCGTHQIIIPDDRLRSADSDHIAHIAGSIAQNGLQHPITVVAHPSKSFTYILVAGLHRLRAMESLKETPDQHMPIMCNVYPAGTHPTILRLMEINENLCRHELSVMDRMKFLTERKSVYEELYPETVNGGDRKSDIAKSDRNNYELKKRFSLDSAEKVGVSESTIQKSVATCTALKSVWDELLDLPCQHLQTDLIKLSKLPQSQIKDAVRFVREAFEFPDDSDPRMQKLSFAIKAVCDPEKIQPTMDEVGFTQKRINSLTNIFNDVSNDALMDWATENMERLESLMAQAKVYSKVRKENK